MLNINAPAIAGSCTRCMTSPTASVMPWKASRIHYALWSSRITGRSTTGYWTISTSTIIPPQIEFSRLALEHTVMSKRLLNQMVDDGVVSGWDDPRMPTIAGLRRRGVPASAIRDFCKRIGITKQDGLVEMGAAGFLYPAGTGDDLAAWHECA